MSIPAPGPAILRGRALALTSVGLALAMAVNGCTGEKKGDTGEPPLGVTPVVRSAGDIVLPLDAYLPTDAALETITNAQTILIRQCLAEFGLEYPVQQRAGGARGSRELKNARRYYVIDAASAGVNGYHISEDARRDQRDIASQREQGGEISTDVINVMEGRGPGTFNGRPVPEGGCSKEAVRKLAGNRADQGTIDVQRLQVEAFTSMQRDSRVAAVSRQWSACMKEQGYDYATPTAANDDQRWSSESPTAEEIATAVADVGCKTKFNVAGVMLAVETAYQKRTIDQHVTEFNALKTLNETEVANAAKVLAAGGK